jgi:alkylhydroperoxidase family enzyme
VRGQLDDDRQLVELVGVVAAYNMVSRFLVALGIEPEGPAEGSGGRDDR